MERGEGPFRPDGPSRSPKIPLSSVPSPDRSSRSSVPSPDRSGRRTDFDGGESHTNGPFGTTVRVQTSPDRPFVSHSPLSSTKVPFTPQIESVSSPETVRVHGVVDTYPRRLSPCPESLFTSGPVVGVYIFTRIDGDRKKDMEGRGLMGRMVTVFRTSAVRGDEFLGVRGIMDS